MFYRNQPPNNQKNQWIRTLILTAITRCSSMEVMKQENFLLMMLQRKEYSRNSERRTVCRMKRDNEQWIQSNRWITLPYIEDVPKVTVILLHPQRTTVVRRPSKTMKKLVSKPKYDLEPRKEMMSYTKFSSWTVNNSTLVKPAVEFSIGCINTSDPHEDMIHYSPYPSTKTKKKILEAWYSRKHWINWQSESD